MRIRIQAAVLLTCICMCGCETTDSSPEKGSGNADVAYVHPQSKFSFPKRVGNFRFVGVREYDRDGKDVSAGYNSPTPVAATVYVYPAAKNFTLIPSKPLEGVTESLIEHEFQRRKMEIAKVHSDTRLLSEEPFEITQGNNHIKGKKAVYSMAYAFGLSNRDSISELYIFLIEPGTMFLADDRQYVEYRITYPTKVQDLATNEIAHFFSELTWPTK